VASGRFIHLVSVEAHLRDLEDRLNERGIFSGNPMTGSPAREGDGMRPLAWRQLGRNGANLLRVVHGHQLALRLLLILANLLQTDSNAASIVIICALAGSIGRS
jgi:hypothetical protein